MKTVGAVLFVCLFAWVSFTGCAQHTASQNLPSSRERAKAKETLGISLIQEGNLQGGLKELIQAGELDPSDAGIQNSIGGAYRSAREFEKAVIHYQRALALKPDFPEARNNLGTVYASMGRWEQAIPLFEKAANDFKYDNRHVAYENLGTVYFFQKKYDIAIGYYQRSLGLEPRYGPAYENMGMAYEHLRQWDSAKAAYERAVGLDPKNPRPLLYLGRLYKNMKRYDEAEKALNKAIENDISGTYAEESRRLLKEIERIRSGLNK